MFFKNFALLTLFFILSDVFLFGIFKRKKTPRYMKFKNEFFGQTAFMVPLLLLTMMYSYFIADREVLFECDKETMLCVYSRSTEYDKTMRVSEKNDLSSVTHASVSRHIRSRRSRSYTVDLKGKKKFKIPHSFSHSYDAETEAEKFNRFLNSDQKKYEFMVLAPDFSFGRGAGVVAFLLLGVMFVSFFFRMLSDMWKDARGIPFDPNSDKGDYAGKRLQRRMRKAGIPEERIKAFFYGTDEKKTELFADGFDSENKIKNKPKEKADNVIERSNGI